MTGGDAAVMQVSDGSGNSLRVRMQRRRQILVIALDVSGSMAGSRIRSAVAGVKQVLDGLSAEDLVAVATFNDTVTDFTDGFMEATPSNIRRLKSSLDSIKCCNQTAFYDAVLKCTGAVLQLSQKIKQVRQMTQLVDRLGQAAGLDDDLDVDLGHAWLVVVTDGDDNKSKHSYDECAKLLLMLAVCGLDYNVLWLGVSLSGKALKEVMLLDGLCGPKSEFCPVTATDIGSKFQEIAVKLRGSRQHGGTSGRPALPALSDKPQGRPSTWQGEIQPGSHVEILRTVGSIQRGEIGTAIAKDANERYKVVFYRDGGSPAEAELSSRDIRVNHVADAIRPGARVRVKPQITPRGGWGPANSSYTGLVKSVSQTGVVTVDFGSNAHGWMAHISELEPVDHGFVGHLTGPFQIGNLVSIPDHVGTPSKGWGSVKKGSMGYITEKSSDGVYRVNFPEADNWMCVAQDIEIVTSRDKIRPGKSVRVCVDNPKFKWGNVRPGSIGVVRYIKYDASIVHVDFPEMKEWKCPISELELCDAVVEFD